MPECGGGPTDGRRDAVVCQCGCGATTPVAKQTRANRGHVKGEPVRFIRGHNAAKAPVLDRIAGRWHEEDRGYATPCLIWDGRTSTSGYGVIACGHVDRPVHRLRYEAEHGKLGQGLEPDHLCRQRDCVRVDHLEAVSHAVNIQRGAHARLTPGKVRQIRRLHEHLSFRHIADELGVTHGVVADVLTGRTWRNVV